MTTILSPVLKTEENRSLQGTLESLEAQCRNCRPITPLDCIRRCQVYKLKNELRRLRETMDRPDYVKELFNVLKSETRLYILQAISHERCSVGKLQGQLRKIGYIYGQDTINEKCVRPLIGVGLADEAREEYYATSFGCRINKELCGFPEFALKLSAHSECHEEALLQTLLWGPKTFQELEPFMALNITSRVLKRLLSAGLIDVSGGREYIFFFKSKRDPNKETLNATEQKIYNALAKEEGISVGKLAFKTGFGVRGTYKYLKRLKRKKLVFLRRTPKTYSLTSSGRSLTLVLTEIEQIVEDTWSSSQQVMR
ncbi:MAG: hypothetical protein ACXV2C_05020 [Candidatus Bathyarchaeia archaeon]